MNALSPLRRIALITVVALAAQGLAAQSTWTGAVNSAWNASGNWSGPVPSAAVGAVIPAGTPNSPSTAGVVGAACSTLTLATGATLTIPAGSQLDVNSHLTLDGSVTGGGTLRIAGSFAVTFSGSGQVGANVVLDCAPGTQIFTGGVTTLAVNGNLTHLNGNFSVGPGGVVFTVNGNAVLQGGNFAANGLGTLDVSGNVTFSGSVATNCPIVRCGGNWTSDANFAPTFGQVVFDGSGAQSVSIATHFNELTVEAGSSVSLVNLTVKSSLQVNGSLALSGTLDVDQSVTVSPSGSLSLGGGTHTVGGSWTGAGGLTAGGTIVLDGPNPGITVSSAAPLPSVQIVKAPGTAAVFPTNVAISGNLLVNSGSMLVGPGGIVVSVAGNGLFQGGTLAQNGLGTLDVAGNITFAGTTVASGPIVRCGGNWTSDASFAPVSGHVVFDGSGAQSVSTATHFNDLTIETGSSVSLVDLTVTHSLQLNGSLAISGTLDVDQNVTVSPSGSLNLGSGTHTVGASWAGAGGLTAGGTIVLDGANPATVSSAAPLPSVQVAKVPGAAASFQTGMAISGNLLVSSGALQVGPGGIVVSVSGNGVFQGGTLASNAHGILDVAGDVTFSGTAVSLSPGIRCAGNWTADAGYAPASGFPVELDGPGPATIAHVAAGGTLTFPSLVLKSGTRTFANDLTIAAPAITIDAGASLTVAGGRRARVHHAAVPTAFAVNGMLGIGANGELSLGPQTTLAVGATGSLGITGAPAQPARITGEAGGGYGLSVSGLLAAGHFLVKDAGPGGMLVDFGATIAPAPNDLRNGTFDVRAGAPAGSVLLDLRRQAPAPNFDGLTFLNTPGAAGVFNVRTSAAGVPIGFKNHGGAFAGPAFENDPGSLIAWNALPAPSVSVFVLPGAQLAEIVWSSAGVPGVASWELWRAASGAGPFGPVQTVPNPSTSHAVIDAPLPANQPVFYALYAVMTDGERLHVGGGSATPYSSAPPANVKKVGGFGNFATIQAAIDAATDANSVVWVTPGTYDSFTVGATAVPSNLRILGDGTGPVNVSTANGPIQILNVPASSGVELSNLNVGAPSEPHGGIVISGCSSPVVLDELAVSCDAANTAVSVITSPATAIQRSAIQGGTGLGVSNGSYVAISGGSLSSLVSTGSTIEMAELAPGSVNVTPAGSLIARTGVMPEIDLPEFLSLSQPSALFLAAQPNAPFVIGASTRLGFLTGPPGGFEMPFLLDPVTLTQLPMMLTDGLGNAIAPFEVPPVAALLGFSFTVQVVVGDPVSGTPRLSNVESMVCMP